MNDLLEYKNLKIFQDDDWFKFSLDSVLLANFATINLRCNKILDMCTGNAPIPLIMTTRTNKEIIGIELQKPIYDLAIKSVKYNNLENKISIINDDINNLNKNFSNDSFDLITCNPPYFKVEKNSYVCSNDIKSVARHEIFLNLEDVFSVSSKLLKNGGILSLVHRPERFVEIIDLMRKYKIEPKRVKFVYPKLGKKSNILLIEGIMNGNSGLDIESPLYVYDEFGNYTHDLQEYIKINL